jgi:hypothetical protein
LPKPETAHLALLTERRPQTIIHAIGHPYTKVIEQPYKLPFARYMGLDVPAGKSFVSWETLTAEVYRFRSLENTGMATI